MAITANAMPVGQPPVNAVPFIASMYSADVSGGEDLKAAVALKSIYVKKLQIICDTTVDVDIGVPGGKPEFVQANLLAR